MRPETFDSMAGERARQIREHPGVPQRILDPTDPRYGKISPESRDRDADPTLDPTDPRYRKPRPTQRIPEHPAASES
jgi:hypothetical protein